MSADADDLAARLARIRRLINEYRTVKTQSVEARTLAERIHREVERATKQVQGKASERPQPARGGGSEGER